MSEWLVAWLVVSVLCVAALVWLAGRKNPMW